MYIFVKFDCKDLKQYDFPFMDNTIIWIWITNKFNWEGGGGGVLTEITITIWPQMATEFLTLSCDL